MIYEEKDLPSYFKDMVVDYISLVPSSLNDSKLAISHTTTSLEDTNRHPNDRNCTNYILLYDKNNKMMKMRVLWETGFSTYLTLMMSKV